jgi:catechol-2,3-dioxygenase
MDTRTETTSAVVAPARMAHFVLQSNQMQAAAEWYTTVFGCEVMHANERICFLTFDDEHHRLAIVQNDDLTARDPGACGVNHIAFTYASLDQLLGTYERLRDAHITPYWCVNHGMSTSLYYRDPDGNQIELQIDNFATPEEGKAVFRTQQFAGNVRGGDFDVEEMVAAWRGGAQAQALIDASMPG